MTEANRQVIRVTGADRATFLQGLISNDVSKLESGLVYAAMLTPQGKYIADFFLVPAGDAILIDVAEPLAASLMQRLGMYKLRADVSLDATELTVSRGLGDAPEGAFADPRHPSLGWRAYDGRPSDEGVDWTAIRIAALVPESGIELTPDTYILEAGFEALNGVDFRKGCYVGQEVTARMKHKTELRKGLLRVRIGETVPQGAEIRAGDKVAGTVLSRSGDQAIAYLRLDRVNGTLTADGAPVTILGE